LLSVALKTAASGIILVHNHPSGNLQPSAQDKEITQKIIAASKLLDITILDHLIISMENTFYSFVDEGVI
jgi:DNA repair protein RadC